MTLTRSISFKGQAAARFAIFISLWLTHQLNAASLQSGLNPAGENTEAFRSYGSYLIVILFVLIASLLIFRGREISKQHPRIFN